MTTKEPFSFDAGTKDLSDVTVKDLKKLLVRTRGAIFEKEFKKGGITKEFHEKFLQLQRCFSQTSVQGLRERIKDAMDNLGFQFSDERPALNLDVVKRLARQRMAKATTKNRAVINAMTEEVEKELPPLEKAKIGEQADYRKRFDALLEPKIADAKRRHQQETDKAVKDKNLLDYWISFWRMHLANFMHLDTLDMNIAFFNEQSDLERNLDFQQDEWEKAKAMKDVAEHRKQSLLKASKNGDCEELLQLVDPEKKKLAIFTETKVKFVNLVESLEKETEVEAGIQLEGADEQLPVANAIQAGWDDSISNLYNARERFRSAVADIELTNQKIEETNDMEESGQLATYSELADIAQADLEMKFAPDLASCETAVEYIKTQVTDEVLNIIEERIGQITMMESEVDTFITEWKEEHQGIVVFEQFYQLEKDKKS